MRRWVILAALPVLVGASSLPTSSAGRTVDHGQMGQTWPVIEPDLLAVIKARLDQAQATGKLDELNQRFADKV